MTHAPTRHAASGRARWRSPVSRCSPSCRRLHGRCRAVRRADAQSDPDARPHRDAPARHTVPEAYRPEGDWTVTFALPGDFITETWQIV